MHALIIAISVLVLSGTRPALAQDFARETRWSDEIVPGLVVGDAVWLSGSSGRKFLGLHTEVKGAKAAVLLIHGIGVHPDFGVIGSLRVGLADAGYATLAIQMPVQKADANSKDYYPAVFPDAVERIRIAGRWLQEKGYARIVLLSHSMGSWMSNVYFEQTENSPFAAWVCMGLTGGFGGMGNVQVPVLDVYGEKDLPNVLGADWRRKMKLGPISGSRQVRIAGADHHYAGREKALTETIDAFLREQVLK